MADDRKLVVTRLHHRFGLDAYSDLEQARVPCDLCQTDGDAEAGILDIHFDEDKYACDKCNASGSLLELDRKDPNRTTQIVARSSETLSATSRDMEPEPEFMPAPLRAESSAARTQPKVLELKHRLPSAAEREAAELEKQNERRRSFSEKLIIATLALIFLAAGLASAALSGYANYHAFSQSVADPLQSAIWGWTGVIAAVISFGGFTLFYWHRANKRPWEGLRSLIFALVGAGTSILGTQMYIAANAGAADAEVEAAQSNRAVIEAQIADWRTQLAGIPPGTRTVEGLEAYIAEVERVGKTDHKPYRDAKNELGLAKRRDDLQARIDGANATLLGKGDTDILLTAQTRTRVPGWFFAVILEVFSSQGTSIGLVALLLLFGRGQRTRAA